MIPFGDRAVRFDIPRGAPRRSLLVELRQVPNVTDVVLAEDVGCIVFGIAPRDADRAVVRDILLRSSTTASGEEPGTSHVIEVVYDGEDLDAVAQALGRTREDVIALHSDGEYRVAMIGFLPGFAYLTGLAEELRLARRSPRPRVPAGSVAIGASYTGIYPFASPGGWHLLGRAPSFAPFDARTGHATFAIGDVVRFTSSPGATGSAGIAPALSSELPSAGKVHVEITRSAGVALLVDGGRPGRMHEGVPPGGPLVRSAFERANAGAGNAPNACAIELSGTLEITARGGPIVVADDESGPHILADGERHALSTNGRTRARYVAVGGGVDAPIVLGSRGALLACGIGTPLRRGTRLGLGRVGSDARGGRAAAPLPAPPAEDAIAIAPGPDADVLPFEHLLASELRISPTSDRTGTRLEGTVPFVHTEANARRSTPMVLGAIELTPSGLVVLGPDHPTTGGYPVVAVVRAEALDSFFARPFGATIRFRG